MKMKFKIGAILFAVLLAMSLIFAATSIQKIKPGYAGIIYNMSGGIQENTLSQGWHWVLPSQKVVEYPVSTETVYLSKDKMEGSEDDDSFDIGTADGKPVNVDASFSYHVDPLRLPEIFNKFRGRSAEEIAGTFMRQSLKASLNNTSTTYGMYDIYGAKRTEMTSKAFKLFQKDMNQFGIVVENMNLMAVRPDQASMEAIQQKVNAIQALEKAKIDNEKELIAAQKNLDVAKKTAEQKLVLAQGEAKANAALSQSMTDQLVRYKQLEVQKAQAEAMANWPVQYLIQGGSPDSMILPSPTVTPIPAKK
jgi:hypothetical protein